MVKNGKNGKGGNGGNGNGKYPGRPKPCEKIPGQGACAGQVNGPKNGLCRNCRAEGSLKIRIKVFGR